MADKVVGFLFADRSFFNSIVAKQEFEALQNSQFAEWNLQRLAGELASKYRANLTSNIVIEFAVGGLFPQLNLPLNTILLAQEQEGAQAQPRLLASTSQSQPGQMDCTDDMGVPTDDGEGKVQCHAPGKTDQVGTAPATPVREMPECRGTTTPTGPLAAQPDTPFIRRKRKASDPPEWVKGFDAKVDRLAAVQEDKNRLLEQKNHLLEHKNHLLEHKNRLLKERNDLLRELVHGARPNLNAPPSS